MTLKLDYVRLCDAILWEDNPKGHNIPDIIASIEKHGFRDPPQFDTKIQKGGGISAGNGRTTALQIIQNRGDAPPAHIDLDKEGEWCLPMIFGGDSISQEMAKQYAVDHNLLTLGVAHVTVEQVRAMFGSDTLSSLFEDSPDDELPITISRETLEALGETEQKSEISLDNFENSLAEGFADSAQFGVKIQLIVDLTQEQADSPGLKEGLHKLSVDHGFTYKIKSRK